MNRLVLLAATAVLQLTQPPAQADVLRHVDPFIGTDGTGHVYPGAATPFGMVAPGPDNADRGWSYSSGYQKRTPTVLGFSNTHISGAGIPELGDILLQPVSGAPWTAATQTFATNKGEETARPGYFSMHLPAHGVHVELTATQRVALHRYRFDKGNEAQVLVDLQHGLLFGDGPRVLRSQSQVDVARGEISGVVFAKNWVTRQTSFIVRFDRPILSFVEAPRRVGENASRYILTFALGADRRLEARVALSTVDEAGARNNLSETDRARFDQVREQATRDWGHLLSRVQIDASPKQKRIFYSALYRAMLHPSDIADRDGRVRGPKGRILQAPGGRYYSTLSLWDTFRGVHPLLTLVAPERVDGFVQTLLAHHAEQGYLPLWTAWGQETWTMIGNPALPVISDAVAKGFSGFDRDAALRAMIETSTQDRPDAPAHAQRSWAAYERFGYLPFDLAPGESVSKTLEYGYGDAAVALVAEALDEPEIAARFHRRAQGYRLLFDRETGAMRGRDSEGAWRTPFDPLVPTSPMNNPGDYTEANAMQYTLTPGLHDPEGLRDVIGGADAMEAWLDRFFTLEGAGDNKHLGQEAMIGQYAHGNEPSHHIAFLYLWTRAPWKAEAMARRIAESFYDDTPDGLIGNDDAGQMGAWYILASLGLYPVEPGEGVWTLTAPLIKRARICVSPRKCLSIHRGRSGLRDRVLLDGQPMREREIAHATLANARTLDIAPYASTQP